MDISLVDKIADSVPNCARRLNLGTSTFRREYIDTGLITPVDLGARGESIILEHLRIAVERRAAEQIADPTKKKPRSAGAAQKARGAIANPWGRGGRPKDLKAAKR